MKLYILINNIDDNKNIMIEEWFFRVKNIIVLGVRVLFR